MNIAKLKEVLRPDLRAIIQSLYSNIVWYGPPLVVTAFWYFASRFDPLNLRLRVGQIFGTLPYLLMAIGAGAVALLCLKLWHRLHPPILQKFSHHLEKLIKGKDITGRGLIFLNSIKKAPPFLGLPYPNPVLSAEHEKAATEYFQAIEFVATNDTLIRGGGYYQCRYNDTWESIAEKEYGDKQFSVQLQVANPSSISPPPNGSYITRPRIDVSQTLGLTSEQIEIKYDIAQDKHKAMSNTFSFLMNNLHLIYDEALRLLKFAYEAACLTINEQK